MSAFRRWTCLVCCFGLLGNGEANAQQQTDSLRLSTLQAEAARVDPRGRQLDLQRDITSLRLASLRAERLPALSLSGQGQYQSAVTTVAVPLPNVSIPTPPHDTYDAHVSAQQTLFDPTRGPRQRVEQAQLAESQAQIRTTVFAIRQELNDAFFLALTLQERAAQVSVAIVGLEARLRETVIRFREGASLPGDTAAIAAAILQRSQERAQLRADRSAALARIAVLAGHEIGDTAVLALPATSVGADSVLRMADRARARPEFAQFEATRARLELQEAVRGAQDKPRVSAFARGGIGRPGLNALSTSIESYWLTGVQVQWAPWTWGTTDRARQEIELQRAIVATNEAAFASQLARSTQPFVATIRRLDSTLVYDDRIVALREEIERETGAKLREGVVTASEYVDRNTELLAAQLARTQHRIELAQAQVNLLTTLGVEIP